MTETLESAYRQHAEELVSYATAMIGPDDAAGLVTDAMVAVFARYDDRIRIDNLRAYLFRAVHHRVIDFGRSESRRRRREERWHRHRPTAIIHNQRAFDARSALGVLSTQQRSVVFLTYWCDLTPHDIAEMLDVGEGTVRKQLARGRARLKEVIDV